MVLVWMSYNYKINRFFGDVFYIKFIIEIILVHVCNQSITMCLKSTIDDTYFVSCCSAE